MPVLLFDVVGMCNKEEVQVVMLFHILSEVSIRQSVLIVIWCTYSN